MPRNKIVLLVGGALALLLICGLFILAIWLVRGQLGSRIEQAMAGPLPPEPLVGQLGGGVLTCVVRDDYAYVGIGHHLAVLDIRDPAKPALVGQSPALPRPVENVALYDRYAYILDPQVGLRIIDIGDPTAPREVGLVRIGRGMNERVATAGHYAYVADFDKLYTLDLQNPLQPIQVSALAALFVPRDLVVADGYAYVLNSNSMLIIDVKDPKKPAQVGSYHISMPQRMALSDGCAYILSINSFEIVSVADPTLPQKVFSMTHPANLQGVAVHDGRLYLTREDSSDEAAERGLYLYDISDPSAPKQVGFLHTGIDPDEVSIANSYAWATTGHGWFDKSSFLYVLDVSDPANPVQAGLFEPPLVSAQAIEVSGDYAYLIDNLGSLVTVAITDATTPRLVSTCHVADAAEDVALDGTSAYVAGKGGLYVVDVKDPLHPIQVGVYPLPDQAHRVVISGSRAYVLDDKQLLALDVSTPSTPRLLGSYDLDGNYADLAVSGDLVYVARWDGLHILDASRPEQIAQVGLWSVQDVRTPFVEGQTVYLFVRSPTAAAHTGLYVVDVSTPSNPVEQDSHSTDIGDSITVADGYAYVLGSINIRVFRLPSSQTDGIRQAGFYDYDFFSVFLDAQATNGHLFLADEASGLIVLDLSKVLGQPER